MSNPTFVKISYTPSAAVATDDTFVLDYPAGYSSTTVKSTGAKMYLAGLGNMLSQGSTAFTVAYSSDPDITVTYKDDTSIPAGTSIDFYLPVPDALDALTDSTTGTASQTLAAVTNPTLSDWNGSSVYPSAAQATAINAALTSLKNSVASLAAKLTAVQTAIKNGNINPV